MVYKTTYKSRKSTYMFRKSTYASYRAYQVTSDL